MTFPSWAPAYLTEMASHKFLHTEDKDLLLLLITDKRMERVWIETTRRAKFKDAHEGRMFFSIRDAAMEAKLKHRTREEDECRYLAIAKAAREFSMAVKGSKLDTTPYRYYPRQAMGSILGRFNPDFFQGYFCLVDDLNEHVGREAVFSPHPIKTKDGAVELWPVALTLSAFFEFCFIPAYPTVSETAEKIADAADILARNALTEQRILPRPNVENADRLYFVRKMGAFFKEEYGGYLYRTLATLTSVVLKDEVDENIVRFALRT